MTRKRTGTWPPTRPPDAGEPRTERLEIRLSPAEAAELQDACYPMALGTWLRERGLEAARAYEPKIELQRP